MFHGYGDGFKSVGRQLVVAFDSGGHLGDAGRAVGCPEFDHNNFALQVLRSDTLPVQGGEGHVGGLVARTA